jgi:hypothetical protein
MPEPRSQAGAQTWLAFGRVLAGFYLLLGCRSSRFQISDFILGLCLRFSRTLCVGSKSACNADQKPDFEFCAETPSRTWPCPAYGAPTLCFICPEVDPGQCPKRTYGHGQADGAKPPPATRTLRHPGPQRMTATALRRRRIVLAALAVQAQPVAAPGPRSCLVPGKSVHLARSTARCDGWLAQLMMMSGQMHLDCSIQHGAIGALLKTYRRVPLSKVTVAVGAAKFDQRVDPGQCPKRTHGHDAAGPSGRVPQCRRLPAPPAGIGS